MRKRRRAAVVLHVSRFEGVERVVLALADVLACVELVAALTDDDLSGEDVLI
jgi:hypothetical protein